jgi:murein L,D-transpeptidase YcbB/YkuD
MPRSKKLEIPNPNRVAKSILSNGNKGVSVSILRKYLSYIFQEEIEGSNMYDTELRKYVKRLQQEYGLKANGIYNAETEALVRSIIKE